jgi:hypothetical protein
VNIELPSEERSPQKPPLAFGPMIVYTWGIFNWRY